MATVISISRGIVVLMKTNASYRLWDSNKSSATATAISSFSDHCNVPQDLGRFLVICNPLRRERVCSACDVVWFSSMPKCGRCKGVRYCSRFCQKRHWAEHRQVCRNVIVHTYNNNDRKIRNGESRKNRCNAWKPDTIGQSWHDKRDPLYDYEKKTSPMHQHENGRDPPPTNEASLIVNQDIDPTPSRVEKDRLSNLYRDSGMLLRYHAQFMKSEGDDVNSYKSGIDLR